MSKWSIMALLPNLTMELAITLPSFLKRLTEVRSSSLHLKERPKEKILMIARIAGLCASLNTNMKAERSPKRPLLTPGWRGYCSAERFRMLALGVSLICCLQIRREDCAVRIAQHCYNDQFTTHSTTPGAKILCQLRSTPIPSHNRAVTDLLHLVPRGNASRKQKRPNN